MSERTFALGCVGLALAFGIVVPDPGKRSAAPPAPELVMARPGPEPARQQNVNRTDGRPFTVHHAASARPVATPALFWATRQAQ